MQTTPAPLADQSVHRFGLSYVATAYHRMLAELARESEIFIYTLGPCLEDAKDFRIPADPGASSSPYRNGLHKLPVKPKAAGAAITGPLAYPLGIRKCTPSRPRRRKMSNNDDYGNHVALVPSSLAGSAAQAPSNILLRLPTGNADAGAAVLPRDKRPPSALDLAYTPIRALAQTSEGLRANRRQR